MSIQNFKKEHRCAFLSQLCKLFSMCLFFFLELWNQGQDLTHTMQTPYHRHYFPQKKRLLPPSKKGQRAYPWLLGKAFSSLWDLERRVAGELEKQLCKHTQNRLKITGKDSAAANDIVPGLHLYRKGRAQAKLKGGTWNKSVWLTVF